MEVEQRPRAVIYSAAIAEGRVNVVLSDGRELSTPLEWYPTLAQASHDDLNNFEISPFGLHWEGLDEDLGLAGMLAGQTLEKVEKCNLKREVYDVTEYKEQRRLSLLADSLIDYPNQHQLISSLVNE